MTLRCSLLGHDAGTARYRNRGQDFAICHHCGSDLMRAGDADWATAPEGFRIVWREVGRSDDAASVAERMHATAPPPRRRQPRNARPPARRDPRGRPMRGAASMLGVFAGLGKLIDSEPPADNDDGDTGNQYVICLPSTGTR